MFRPTSDSPHTLRDSSSSKFGSGEFDFLERLHRVLDDSGDSQDPAICWNLDGLSFQIRDAVRFEKFLVPLYFGETTAETMNLETFWGNLRAYGFHRICTEGVHKDTCSHPLFVKGKKELMQRMCRNQEKFLYERRDSWPMPPLLLRGNHPVDAALAVMADPNPKRSCCPKVLPRKALAPSRPIDKRISFRETLLRRRRRNSGCHTVYLDFLSCDKTVAPPPSMSRCEDERNEEQPRNNNDEVVACTTTAATTDDQPDVEPLNPLCHEEDGSLYNDLAAVLAAI